MFFFRLKMSAMVDAIAMVCMFVASSIALECGDSLFGAVLIVFVALFIELGLSLARVFELEDMFRLWTMEKKEVDRLKSLVSRQSLAHTQKKPLKRNNKG